MRKFEGVLLCTDLDGTLLRDSKTVSKENKDAIEFFKSEGGLFTFITGRPPMIARDIYEMVKPNAPVGCFNGGGIYDFENRKFLWSVELPSEAIELVKYAVKEIPDMGVQLNTADRIMFTHENTATQWFRDVTNIPNDACDIDEVNETVIKILFCHDDSATHERLARLLSLHPKSQMFDYIRSEEKLYEILPKGISKGDLLIRLADILGIDRKKTVAVGDYNNDISMIKAAGIGYAVGNAIPEVKSIADRVTVSNEEHAIAKIIEDLENSGI